MTTEALKGVLARAETWPEWAQAELTQIALEIEAEMFRGNSRATAEELAGIDRGLKAAREERFASEAEVEAVFTKHNRS